MDKKKTCIENIANMKNLKPYKKLKNKQKRLNIILFLIVFALFIGMFYSFREEGKQEIKIKQKPENIGVAIMTGNVETKTVEKKSYQTMPEQLNGYTVIGKVEIPKIESITYILEEMSKKSLNVSAAKLCGPEINQIGNFCIAGHNRRTFSGLKKLEIGDQIIVTDIYDDKCYYQVYDIQIVKPDEVECLSQDTEGEREITLITCTISGLKRLIIKAVEIYD